MLFFGNLIFLKPDGTEKERLPLNKPAGSSNVSFIRLKHPHVSYEQCRVDIHRDGAVFLINLSQTPPILLNNEPVTSLTKVFHNDVFTILDRSFRFELQPDLEYSNPNQPNQHLEKVQTADPQQQSTNNCLEKTPKKGDCKRVQLSHEGVCTEWNRQRVEAGYEKNTEFAYHLLRLHERACSKCENSDTAKPNLRTPTSPHHINIETSEIEVQTWNVGTLEQRTPPATPPSVKGSEGKLSEGNTRNTLSSTVMATTHGGAVTPDLDVDTPVLYFRSPSQQHMWKHTGKQTYEAEYHQFVSSQCKQTYSTFGEDNVRMQAAKTKIRDEDSGRNGIITISDDSSENSDIGQNGNDESIGIRSGALATHQLQQTTARASSNTGSKQFICWPLPEQSQQIANRQLSSESSHGRDSSSVKGSDSVRALLLSDSVTKTSSHQLAMDNHIMQMDVIQSTPSEKANTLRNVRYVKQAFGGLRKIADRKDPCNDRLHPIKKRKRWFYTLEEKNILSYRISDGGVEGSRKHCHSPPSLVIREQESTESPSQVTVHTPIYHAVTEQQQQQHVAYSSTITQRLKPHSASTTPAEFKKTNKREISDALSPARTDREEDTYSTFADLVMEVTSSEHLPFTLTTPQGRGKIAPEDGTLTCENKGGTSVRCEEGREDVVGITTNTDLFMCHECTSGFGDCWSCLVLHNTVGRTMEEKPTKCHLCDALFNDTEILRRHMHDIHDIESFAFGEEHLCPDCMTPCTPCNPQST